MTAACIGFEAFVIVVLLAALLYGQPAASQVDRARLNTQATMIVVQSTQIALSAPTPRACRSPMPQYGNQC